MDISSAGISSPDAEKILSGTSMAAPQVAGQSLLIAASLPQLGARAVREVILSSATNGTLSEEELSRSPRAMVALVPYQRMETTASTRGSNDNNSGIADTSFDGDIVAFDVKMASRTDPPMQYVANQIENELTQHFNKTHKTFNTKCRRVAAENDVGSALVMRCAVKTASGGAKSVVSGAQGAIDSLREPGGGRVLLIEEPIIAQRAGTEAEGSSKLGIVLGCSIAAVVVLVIVGAVFYRKKNERGGF